MAQSRKDVSIAAKLDVIQQAYLEMGEPVTEERLKKLASAVNEGPESLLRLIEAVGTIRPADSSSAGKPDQAQISDKQTAS